MNKEEPEMGRFEPHGKQNEPREPFVDPDAMLKKGRGVPSLDSLHVPEGKLTEKGLKTFLIELKPLVVHIQKLSREDQHRIGTLLQGLKKKLHEESLGKKFGAEFDELCNGFAKLLTHSEPADQEKALGAIRELIQKCAVN